MNKLWKELIKVNTLKRGWHIARTDLATDFAEDIFAASSYAAGLEDRLREVSNRLQTHTYQSAPLVSLEVPKGSLAIRPGKLVDLQDRTVLCAIVFLLAPKLDAALPDAVYSWRLKRPLPKHGSIFKESSIVDMPFLKARTIRRRLDPFDPWYAAWPMFDKASHSTVKDLRYRYLATSDIAAYFENIQLPILRDRLLQFHPDEPKVVNLLFEFLDAWAERTDTGRVHLRGIPQGNCVSSFLGNIFLLPLDEEMLQLERDYDVRYQRYMDDVRVFAKDIDAARIAIFRMDKVLRSLHLNVQSAKTTIYDEHAGEISKFLFDTRIDQLNAIADRLGGNAISQLSERQKKAIRVQLKKVAAARPYDREPISRARKPLSGLSLRAFQRWISIHVAIGEHGYVRRLIAEIGRNPDFRLMKKLRRAAQLYPQKSSIETGIVTFIQSDRNIFPHQEAECIRALRYLSRLSEATIARARATVTDPSKDGYLRVQSAYLLYRLWMTRRDLLILRRLFEREANPFVQAALCGLLVQQTRDNDEVIRQLVFHPNRRIVDIGKLFYRTKSDVAFARDQIRFIFDRNGDSMLPDVMPLLHIMSMSAERKIRRMLRSRLEDRRRDCRIYDIRPILQRLYWRVADPVTHGIEPT